MWDLQSGQCIREQPEGVHHEATLTDALYVNFLLFYFRFSCTHTWTFSYDPLSESLVGTAANFLLESMPVQIAFHNGAPLYLELPVTVEVVVASTEPGLQGDRSSAGTKPATLETGAEIQVPLFINTGDKLKVDTRDGSYVSRVNA